jgi:hypothetical protein
MLPLDGVGCVVLCGVLVGVLWEGVGCRVLCGVVCGSPLDAVDCCFSSNGTARRLHNTITQQTTTSEFFIPFIVSLIVFMFFP